MRAKNVEFDVTYVNLRDKPSWFLEISPHGKVPVLKVGDEILFESNAIAEFLDEVVEPRLHPADPIKRARNRAWTDYISTFAGALGNINYAKNAKAVAEGVEQAKIPLRRLEEALGLTEGQPAAHVRRRGVDRLRQRKIGGRADGGRRGVVLVVLGATIAVGSDADPTGGVDLGDAQG